MLNHIFINTNLFHELGVERSIVFRSFEQVNEYKSMSASYIDNKPTLFNASKSSNLIFSVTPTVDNKTITYVNNLSTYGKRIEWLTKNGYSLKFLKTNSEIFKSSLELIDSKLPEILSHMVLNSYLYKTRKLTDLVDLTTRQNPCNFDVETNPDFYTYKVKRFLTDAALGMKADRVWDGPIKANGGCFIVKKDGNLVCYHIYNWNDFQDYLLEKTKIDYPDSKPSQCDYGRILKADEVEEVDGSYIKLNFQIRFI